MIWLSTFKYWIFGGIIAALLSFAGLQTLRLSSLQTKVAKNDAATAKAVSDAITKRDAENEAARIKQADANRSIQKASDDELTKIRADLATAKRLRIGQSLCPSTGATDPESATSSNATDTGSGLVSVETQQAINGLILEVEQGFAAGRSCQAFVKSNAMEP